MSDEDEDIPVLNGRTPEQDEAIVRNGLKLAEAYVAWAFEDREMHRGILGDAIKTAFRNYLEVAHPKEFAQMRLAEKGFSLPRVVID